MSVGTKSFSIPGLIMALGFQLLFLSDLLFMFYVYTLQITKHYKLHYITNN